MLIKMIAQNNSNYIKEVTVRYVLDSSDGSSSSSDSSGVIEWIAEIIAKFFNFIKDLFKDIKWPWEKDEPIGGSEPEQPAEEKGIVTGKLGYPVKGITSCSDGDYPNYAKSNIYHGGIDINSSLNNGNGYYTLYAHMQNGSIIVKNGDKVDKGDKLGLVCNTGNTTGSHLHFEIRKNNKHDDTLNPCDYIGKDITYVGN